MGLFSATKEKRRGLVLRSGAARTLWVNPSKAGCVFLPPPLPENINLSTNVKEFN